MKRTVTLLLFLVTIGSAQQPSVNLRSYQTCKECVSVGFGWCTQRRSCGGFANKKCGEGEEYFRTDWDGEKTKKKKKKKPKITPDKVMYLGGKNFSAAQGGDDLWYVAFIDHSDKSGSIVDTFKEAVLELSGSAYFALVNTYRHRTLTVRYGASAPFVMQLFKDKPLYTSIDINWKAFDYINSTRALLSENPASDKNDEL